MPNKQFLQILFSMRISLPLEEAQAIPLRPLNLAKQILKIGRLFEQQPIHSLAIEHKDNLIYRVDQNKEIFKNNEPFKQG
jgi:hypothetical protein